MSANHVKLVDSNSNHSSDRKVSGNIAAAVARPNAASESDGGSSGGEIIGPILTMICDWRMERGAFQKAVALFDQSTNFGRLADADDLPSGSHEFENMRSVMGLLATARPGTIAEAREILRMVIEILAWREVDPGSPLSEGPLLELVRNVLHRLDRTDGDIRLGGDSDDAM